MNRSLILVALLGIAAPAAGQSSEENFCSVQFVNASSTPSVVVDVNKAAWYNPLLAGQQTSAGRMPRLSWPLRIRAIEEGTKVETEHVARQGRSYLAVILGDFKKPARVEGEPETTEPLRGEVLFLDNALTSEQRPHRVRIVNGIVDESVALLSADGKAQTVGFGEHVEIDGLAASSESKVDVGGKLIHLPFLFLPPQLGCTVSFYKVGDEVKFVVTNEVVLLPDGSIPSATQDAIEKVMREAGGQNE